MDELRLSSGVRVGRADDDAAVGLVFRMQANKVATVERHDGTPLSRCVCKNFAIRNRTSGFTGFLGGRDIVAILSEAVLPTG
jgi:hypothetical protein